MYHSIYSRYGSIETEEHDTFRDAVDHLAYGADAEQLYQLAIYDDFKNSVLIVGTIPLQHQVLSDVCKACELSPTHIFNTIETGDIWDLAQIT